MLGKVRKDVVSAGVILFALTVCFATQAQEPSMEDTIRLGDLSGEPGDTVSIPVSLVNTFEVAGISFRIEVDPTVLKPLSVDVSGSRVENIYNYLMTQIDTADGSVLWFGVNWDNPQRFYVPPGSGAIAYLICVIQPDAPAGCVSPMEFVDDTLISHITALSDTAHHANLIIPTKEGGLFSVSCVGMEEAQIRIGIPSEFLLNQISPNPFRDEATIGFGCPGSAEPSHVTIKIYDATGRMVKTLFDGLSKSGYHSLKWNGRSDEGSEVPGGVYFCRMNVSNGPQGLMRKVVLLK